MRKTKNFIINSHTVVSIFGILGNILVIISILKQRCLLRSNHYYLLVLQLALCDLGVLILYLFEIIVYVKEPLLLDSVVYCVFDKLFYVFQFAGVGMMLVISVFRYRATVHPFKPAISRRKLKVVCSLVHIVGIIEGYGRHLPLCFVSLNFLRKYDSLFTAIVYNLLPTIFMAVAYYKVGRALFKQSKHINPLFHADAVRKRHIRNRRTFLICLSTVLCYGIGSLPISVLYIVNSAVGGTYSIEEYAWLFGVSILLRIVGSYVANPVIYGILDKQLLAFWKCRKPNTRARQEQFVQQVGETPL